MKSRRASGSRSRTSSATGMAGKRSRKARAKIPVPVVAVAPAAWPQTGMPRKPQLGDRVLKTKPERFARASAASRRPAQALIPAV